MAVAGLACADHLSVGNIEGSKKSRGAVALVIVGVGGSSSLLERQAGLRSIQGLNLTFLIAAQHQCVLWSIEVKTHDVFQFAHEVRIVGDLEGPGQMRFQAVVTPDPSYGGRSKTRRFSHGSCAPMRLSSWDLFDRAAHHRFLLLGRDDRLAAPTGFVLKDASHAFCGKTITPASRFLTRNPESGTDLLVRPTLRGQ